MSRTGESRGAARPTGPAGLLRKRHSAERRFRIYGRVAVALALGLVVVLLASIATRGYSAFEATHIRLEVFLDPEIFDPGRTADPAALARADHRAVVRAALRERFADVEGRDRLRRLDALASNGARDAVRQLIVREPKLIGTRTTIWVPASSDADMFVKGFVSRELPESERRLSDVQIGWLDALAAEGAIETRFNWRFLASGDSREPELAGVWGAVVGSFYTMLVTLALAFPFGVLTAVYLEEFAPRGRWTDLVEVNINNLAAVPSIVFGLLGLAVFLNVFGLPRSAPLVGGLTLALRTLPTIIIATRAALAAVPPWIREAAQGMGASPVQVVLHHVVPLAVPGILTGTIIGMARALGETAPLLMIGMVAFIVDIPSGPTAPGTVLPVQVFLWADSPERGFVEKTAGATMVLLAFLIAMNGVAIYLRKRLERRW
ncbi:MAG: phosphate ABC transporter permease PstA [Alphaproteobacteria bacterium]